MATNSPAVGGGANWPRILPIANSDNLRDMGGYPAADGRRLKWRHLYRSGSMSRLGAAERPALEALGVRTIIDLRSSEERKARPTDWHRELSVDYWSRDYDLSVGDMEGLARRAAEDPAMVRNFVTEIYRALPYELAESYRELFRRLARGEAPLLFHCGAGKDRTGIAALLILSALGVPRETIAADYALTDHVMERLIAKFLNDPKYAGFLAVPREQYLPIFQSDPACLDITYAMLEERHGSVEGYLRDILGVGETETAAIRDLLLE